MKFGEIRGVSDFGLHVEAQLVHESCIFAILDPSQPVKGDSNEAPRTGALHGVSVRMI